jgi:hypothetical protein
MDIGPDVLLVSLAYVDTKALEQKRKHGESNEGDNTT